MENNFVFTGRNNSIFYGDFFVIGGIGCVLFGAGKTRAGQQAINSEEDEIALDMVCITRDNGTIFGHFEIEIGAYHKSQEDPIKSRKEIDCFIRMLSEEETNKLYGSSELKIFDIDKENFIEISKFNITFDMVNMLPVSNQEKYNNFIELLDGVSLIKYIVVPWMDSHKEKGELLKEYLKNI